MRSILRTFGHQKWIKTPLRSRLIGTFHDPETAKEEWFSVRFYGHEYRGNFASCLDWQVYYFGAYATEELNLIRDVLAAYDRPVMMDIGGNCGHHALFASGHCQEVYVFEPYPLMYNQIIQKIDTNSLTNIRLFKFGLATEDATLKFYPPADNHTGLGSFRVETGAEAIELSVRNGDRVAEEEGLRDVQFIKIDVEGFEVDAIKGISILLQQSRPSLFIEWSPASANSLNENFSDLFPSGYQCYLFEDLSYIPFLRVFRKPGYRLHPVDIQNPPIGNLLISPVELNDKVEANRSSFGRYIQR